LLDQRYNDLLTLSESPLIADYDRNIDFKLSDEAETYRKELERALNRFSTRSRVYAQILYLDRRGNEVCRAGSGAAFGAERFAAVASVPPGGWWVSGIAHPSGTEPLVYYAKPIRDERGRLKGA